MFTSKTSTSSNGKQQQTQQTLSSSLATSHFNHGQTVVCGGRGGEGQLTRWSLLLEQWEREKFVSSCSWSTLFVVAIVGGCNCLLLQLFVVAIVALSWTFFWFSWLAPSFSECIAWCCVVRCVFEVFCLFFLFVFPSVFLFFLVSFCFPFCLSFALLSRLFWNCEQVLPAIKQQAYACQLHWANHVAFLVERRPDLNTLGQRFTVTAVRVT